MAKGWSTHLTKQAGEYLVAAELCRQGLVATTFTGNVPHFDILAADEGMRVLPIQVKTVRGGDWQFDAESFLKIEKDSHKKTQEVKGKVALPEPDLIHVFVRISDDGEADRFYVLRWADLQEIVARDYCRYLDEKEGKRPKRWDSTHTRVREKDLKEYENNWELVHKHLHLAGGRSGDEPSS